jgi:hypothetical protein
MEEIIHHEGSFRQRLGNVIIGFSAEQIMRKRICKKPKLGRKKSAFCMQNAGQDQGAQTLSVGGAKRNPGEGRSSTQRHQTFHEAIHPQEIHNYKWPYRRLFGENDADNTISEYAGIVAKQNQYSGVSSGLKQRHRPSSDLADSMR